MGIAIKLTKNQAEFLWTLMKNLVDVSEDDSVVRDAGLILRKIDKELRNESRRCSTDNS